MDIIGEQVKRITSKGSGTLGFTFFSGLAISLWSANAGVKAVFDALNVAYGEEEKRGFIALNLRSLAFTLGMIVFALVAIGAIVVVPVLLNFIGLGQGTEWIISLARWPVLLGTPPSRSWTSAAWRSRHQPALRVDEEVALAALDL